MPCPRYSIKSSNSHHSTPKVEANRNALVEDLFSKLLYCQCLARKSSSSSWRKMSMFSHFFFSWVCIDEAPPSLSPKPMLGRGADHRWLYFSSLAAFPLAEAEKALQVGRVQASQSLNVHPNAFGRFQAHLYFISPNPGDAKRKIWTCFQTIELRIYLWKISIFIEHFWMAATNEDPLDIIYLFHKQSRHSFGHPFMLRRELVKISTRRLWLQATKPTLAIYRGIYWKDDRSLINQRESWTTRLRNRQN